MTTREDAIREMRKMLGRKTDKTFTRFALTGDGTGADTCDVDGRPGWVWVRYDEDQSKVSQVFSEYRGLPEDVPVIVGKLYPEAEYPQIIAINWPLYYNAASSINFDSFLLPQHGQSHGEEGSDRAPIGLRNLEPGKVRQTEPVSLSVYVQRFYYMYAGTLSQWAGDTLDLTASVPGAAGHRYTLVSLTVETGDLNTTDSTVVDLPVIPDIPSVPGGDIPLAVVDLAQGETTIENADIFDMRLLWNGAGIVENHTHSGDGDGGASIVCLEELFFEDIPITLDGSTLIPYAIYHTLYVSGLYDSGDQILEWIQPDASYAGTCPQMLIIRPGPFGMYDTYSITVKHATGNIWLSNELDIVLTQETDHLLLIYNGEWWCDLPAFSKTRGEWWEDLRVAASATTRGASAPDVEPILAAGGIYGYAFDGVNTSEQVFFQVQLAHAYKLGSTIYPHVHWMPSTAAAGNVEWFLEYSWAKIDGVFANPTTISVVDAAAGVAWTHQLANLPPISGAGITDISSMLVCRLYRDPTAGNPDDTYGADAILLEFDIHILTDTPGSRQESSK